MDFRKGQVKTTMTGHEFDVLNYINLHEIGRTDQIASNLQISESTVRRMLDKLEQKGLVVRFHGGASKVKSGQSADVYQRFEKFPKVKNQIAKAAAEMVRDGNIIILLGGTTVACMCKYLQMKRLTVITNSLIVFNMLKENVTTKIILLGGEYSSQEDELKGSLTNSTILQLGADCLFSGATAFDERRGFLTDQVDAIELYNSCFQATKKVIMLADSSKCNKNSIAVIAACDKVDCLITDSGIPDRVVEGFEQSDVEVIKA